MYRIIIEALDADTIQPAKRYILSKTWYTRSEAESFARSFALSSLRHVVVPGAEAHAVLASLEAAQPSRTYSRTGRIWDMILEPCREAERIPAALMWDLAPAPQEAIA